MPFSTVTIVVLGKPVTASAGYCSLRSAGYCTNLRSYSFIFTIVMHRSQPLTDHQSPIPPVVGRADVDRAAVGLEPLLHTDRQIPTDHIGILSEKKIEARRPGGTVNTYLNVTFSWGIPPQND